MTQLSRLRLGLLLACAWCSGVLAQTAPTSIRVVTDDNYPPFVFRGADGLPRGYEVDLWKLWQQKTGIRVTLEPEQGSAARRDLLAGGADVIDLIAGTPRSDPPLRFSAPYATLPVGLYVQRDIHGITSARALRGLEVGVRRGDDCARHLRDLGVGTLRRFPTYEAMLQAARSGELKAFCMDAYPADYYLYLDPDQLRFTRAFSLYTDSLRWAVRADDAAMYRTVADGMALITPAERQRLAERWLRQPLRMRDYAHEFLAALVALAALSALGLLWVRGLRSAVRARTAELHRQVQRAELERARLHTLIETSPDGMWLKDLDGTYLECNSQALQYVGKPREQVLGRRDHDLFPPELADRIRASDLQALKSGVQSRSESTVHDDSGATHELEVIKIPVAAPDGGHAGVLGVARDVSERRRMERTLRLWAEAFHNARFGLSISDARTNRFVDVNPAYAAQRGYTRDELIGQPVTIAVPADLRERYLSDKAAADRARHAVLESEALTRSGRRFPVLLDVTVVHSPNGEAEQRIVYSLDISEHKRAEEEMRIAAVAFESQEGILVTDAGGRIQRVNSAFTRMTGFQAEELLDKHPSLLRAQRYGRRFYARLQRTLRLRGYWAGDLWSARRDGQEFPARVSLSAVRDASGTVLHYVCTMTDTSRERDARRTAERLARYDALTELPNRPHLRELVCNAIAQSARSGELAALIMLDLDHFALLNGAHGHQRGDLVLAALARRMRRALRPGDTVGRFAGDKFVVLMEGLGSDPSYALHRASLMAAQLRDAAAQPFELPDAYVPGLGVSIGLSLYGRDIGAADDGDVLLAQAEAALRRAKNAGRDTLRVFEPQMQAELEARAHLVEELRAGIARDQLLLHLQPQFTGDGRLIGAEALVRWAHPVRGLLYPDAFIALAEESGMIDAIGRQVLRLGCQLLAAWSEHPRLRALRLSVNVSPLQFRREDFVAEVLDAVAGAGIRPDRLELELTESMILHDLDEAMSRLERLRQHGILVSLDDFGTGASSLSYLTRLAMHQLKIDKSFVRKLPESRNDAMVAQTIIMMAKGLGLEVVAEGVETAAQRDFLMLHGCDLYQGYLLGRPVPVEEFVREAEAPA